MEDQEKEYGWEAYLICFIGVLLAEAAVIGVVIGIVWMME